MAPATRARPRRASLLLCASLSLAACVASEPKFRPPDGGPDAEVQDAARDAGRDSGTPRDGGRDAGRMDAFVPDAPAPDADPVDTGVPPDMGVPDVGVPDSGVPPDVGTLIDPLTNAGGLVVEDEGYALAEGPAWSAGEGVVYFTDIQPAIGANPGIIYRYDPSMGDPTNFLTPSGQASGLFVDPRDGTLLMAEFGGRRLSRRLANGTVVAVTERYMGDRYSSVNDVVVRSDGTVYFTDSGQIAGALREINVNGVYRVDLQGNVSRELDRAPPSTPNGLALSYDESLLYVTDQTGGTVLVMVVHPDGTLGPASTLIMGVANADGMATDDAGNIFVATQTGVRAYAPTGTQWPGTLVVNAALPTGNCSFGGPNRDILYVTAGFGLYSFQLTIPGRN